MLILACTLAGACSSAPAAVDVAPETAAEPARALVLNVGEVHVYTLDWRTEATRTGHHGISGGLALEGELAVSAIAHDADGTRVALWFPSLSTREVHVQGQAMVLDVATLVGPRAELIVDADGDVRRAFFDGGSPPIFRELMTGVIARLDLRAAATDGEPRTIRSGHGLVEAVYHRQADGVVTRELAEVVRFDTVPGEIVAADALTSTGRIELDEDHVPVRLELHDSAHVSEGLGLVADEWFSLARTRIDRERVAALVDPIEIDPTAAPDLEASARELDRQYADGFAMDDVAIAMNTMDGGVLPRTGEFSRAAALVRGWPERAQELVPMAMKAGAAGRQLAFDVLSAAGTPQAQDAMCTLLEEAAAASWTERVLLVQRFAFVAAPTDASGEFLLDLVAQAELAGDDELWRATLHPFGTVAGRVSDPLLAERMHAVLVAAAEAEDAPVRAAAVAGLGNARRDDDLPRLLAAVRDSDGNVRVEAVAALRTHVTPEATATLLGALDDESPAVASRALAVLRKRHYAGEAAPALVERALTGRYNPRLDRAMASALASDREDADVRIALAAIVERTADRELATVLDITP